jgi:hypothetical protein
MRTSPKLNIVVAATALVLGACGSSAATSESAGVTPTSQSAAVTPTSAASSAPITDADAAAAAEVDATTAEAVDPEVTDAAAAVTPIPTGKVSANDATKEELVAALDAAGVTNSAKWAKEIEEYRPYSTDDPEFAKLRDELAKYNPADGVIDMIIATLAP